MGLLKCECAFGCSSVSGCSSVKVYGVLLDLSSKNEHNLHLFELDIVSLSPFQTFCNTDSIGIKD